MAQKIGASAFRAGAPCFRSGSAVCHVEQGIELLTAGHQGVKAAAFADLAVFQNENFIIFPQQRLLEPVRNNNTRQALNGQNGGTDRIGRGGIQCCRGLVDEQDGRLPQQPASDIDALPPATGEAGAVPTANILHATLGP